MDNMIDRNEIAMRKQALRKRMSVWRESLNEQDVKKQSVSMSKLLLRLVKINHAHFATDQNEGRPCIGLYNAFRHEADFSSIWRELQLAGWDVSFPLMLKSGRRGPEAERKIIFIEAPAISSDNDRSLRSWFVNGHFGVLEPPEDLDSAVEPDLIVLPGLAFDRQGGRLGWGKAYYDSYLAARSTEQDLKYPLTLGAALEGQLIDLVPCADHDIAVDGIITPSEIVITGSIFVELLN
ncbi:MAG: 5-formyltetrahydrofolate cyclo-ligase [Clostridiaceae bacterium]|nr:5-formyltetrahydrofolate cyclo-ligase [Clostridiaceae bacterium]